MKKAFLMIVAVLLLCGMASAQQHYTFNVHAWENNMPVTTQIQIDGVQQTSTQIELGAFVGDEIRGSVRIGTGTISDQAWLQVYYNESGETVSFKIYDHATGDEYAYCSTTLTTGIYGWGTTSAPVVLNFVTTTYTTSISGFGTGDGNWYLIASPIGEVSPTEVTTEQGNMLDENGYDLYSFDQTQDMEEWHNYKSDNFVLEPGKGYLYANHDDVTLTFAGAAYEGNGTFNLSYVGDSNHPGWNLVGNPFEETAYVDRPFYIMNPEGRFEIIAAEGQNSVEAMEGLFVVASGTGETVTFSTSAPESKGSKVAINLSDGQHVVDRAIIRFDECSQLPKFQLKTNSTKIYIPIGNQDYAVVRSEGMGEIPVNFKAEKNGSYTLSFTAENVELGYMHLIDNMNGNDIDLLQTPSYTFEANVSDSEGRFRVVFTQQ